MAASAIIQADYDGNCAYQGIGPIQVHKRGPKRREGDESHIQALSRRQPIQGLPEISLIWSNSIRQDVNDNLVKYHRGDICLDDVVCKKLPEL